MSNQIHHANIFYEGNNFAILEYNQQVNILNVTDPRYPCAIERIDITEGMTQLDQIKAACDAIKSIFGKVN